MCRKIVVGITGASGVGYGVKMVSRLCEIKTRRKNSCIKDIYVVYSENAVPIARSELGIDLRAYLEENYADCITIYSNNDLSAPIASSSNMIDTDVVIIPCTINTLAKLASGIQDNLITRAALNALRLKNKLVVVIRETPLSLIDTINMLKLSLAGAVVLPAAPAFYTKPRRMSELEDFIVGKVLDVLGIKHNLYKRWGS